MKGWSVISAIVALGLVSVAQAGPFQRMINGQIVTEAVPYHVHIWVYDPYFFTWPASGVIISEKHVLTAAINIQHFNRWDLGFGSNSRRDLEVVISYKGIVHEEFDPYTEDNNIGLIFLTTPLVWSKTIAPISLPTQGELIPKPSEIGTIAAFSYLTGAGPLSNNLEKGIQTIIESEACEEIYPHLKNLTRHYFCAFDEDFNLCGGTQGAAFTVKRDNKDVLAGIVSFGSIWKDCHLKIPPAYMKISEYVNWIAQNTK